MHAYSLDNINLTKRDAFYWYCRMDMATTVAAKEVGIITDEQAFAIASGVASLIRWGDENNTQRPTDYLDIQALLFKITGPISSRMHAGRSRQDMLATLHRLLLRDRLLHLLDALLRIRELFLLKGSEYLSIAVPTYTNGVQAQPALFGHLMCGYESPLSRNTWRYRESFPRLNQSPLGSAALATSRFELDRYLIARLLGFDTYVENAFDAAQLGIVDNGVESAQIAALIALNLNMFTQDLHAQFHHIRPWILLNDASLYSPSTLMPQKRNPVVLNRIRLLGSQVIGASVSAALAAHNVCSGLTDYKRADAANTLDLTIKLLNETGNVLKGIIVDADAALDELETEFTTTSELAALLQEKSDIPFAITHEFASKLVDLCRKEHFLLKNIPYEIICEVFEHVLSHRGINPIPPFPFTNEEFRFAIHPMTMINNYKGKGGSSPDEVNRMMELALNRLTADKVWLSNVIHDILESEKNLESEFIKLILQ